MVAGGLMYKDQEGFNAVLREGVDPLHADAVVAFAHAMLEAASRVNNPVTGQPIRMRVGIHRCAYACSSFWTCDIFARMTQYAVACQASFEYAYMPAWLKGFQHGV